VIDGYYETKVRAEDVRRGVKRAWSEAQGALVVAGLVSVVLVIALIVGAQPTWLVALLLGVELVNASSIYVVAAKREREARDLDRFLVSMQHELMPPGDLGPA
jgi:uncharacterized membrane protein